jgi:hypothetical protein
MQCIALFGMGAVLRGLDSEKPILNDISLPRAGGYQLTLKLKQLGGQAGTQRPI